MKATRRNKYERHAQCQSMAAMILKSLDHEPITVSKLSKRFDIDRRQIRKDISLWIETYGHESPEDTASVVTWRDSHTTTPRDRLRYAEIAVKLINGRHFDVKTAAETLGVCDKALSMWIRKADLPALHVPSARKDHRHFSSTGDMELAQYLEEMRLQSIQDARRAIADDLEKLEAA